MTERKRRAVANDAAEYLRDGEVGQAAIFAQNKGSAAFALFGGATRLTMKHYWIVATNERIIVFDAGVRGIKGMDHEVPRGTQIGAPQRQGSVTRTLYRTEALSE